MAQDTLKIGLILPMTGPFASTGRQIEAAAKLYMQQKGDTVAGKKIQLIVKDDTGIADVTKRLAQELIVNDKVAVMAGFGLTPLALASAPLATQAKVPASGHGGGHLHHHGGLALHRPHQLHPAAGHRADGRLGGAERHQEGRHARFRLRPGHRRREGVHRRLHQAKGGQVENLRVPLANPDFSPFLQKVADAKPDALFVFVPSGIGAQFMKQFVERGLDKSGIKLIGPGDVTDDDLLNGMGDVALGAITTQHYSAAHDSPENKAFVEAFKKANNGMRPNFMAVGGYDGMHLIYEGLKKTNGEGGAGPRRRHEGHELDQPARPGLDRPADPRHRAEHLCAQSRAQGRRALQRGVRHHPERQGPGEGRQVQLIILSEAPSIERRFPTTPGETRC